MDPIFKDSKQQEQFDQEGFLKVRLLTEENVAKLLQLFRKYFPQPSSDFFSSSYLNDNALKREISDAIGAIIIPNLEKVFTNYTCFGSAFLSKGNGNRSEMPMHQDWSIVDEQRYVALNIWTPLQETNEENGTLEVIKGSHKWHSELRAPTLPFYFNGYQPLLKQKLCAIPTMPTEAIVLNQAIIHYSKPNKTNSTRIAITTGVKSRNAPMSFHYWHKDTPEVIEHFSEEDDFLNSFVDFGTSAFLRPVLGESNGLKAFALKKPTQEEVERLTGVASNSGEAGMGVLQKMLKWIKG